MGPPGLEGPQGERGEAGITPHIDPETGNWFVGDHNTGVSAQGQRGEAALAPTISDDGYWVINGEKTSHRAIGEAGPIPTINANGYWVIDGVNTGVSARGQAGITPHVDAITGNWFIGAHNTHVRAQGRDGASVISIGTNGNWFINDEDTGVRAQGLAGLPGAAGTVITISADNTWVVNDVDTEIPLTGSQGPQGTIVSIGHNGNWFIDGDDTHVRAQGSANELDIQIEGSADFPQGVPFFRPALVVRTPLPGGGFSRPIWHGGDHWAHHLYWNGLPLESGNTAITAELGPKTIILHHNGMVGEFTINVVERQPHHSNVIVDVGGDDFIATVQENQYVFVSGGNIIVEWDTEVEKYRTMLNFASPVDISQLSEFMMDLEVDGWDNLHWEDFLYVKLNFTDGYTMLGRRPYLTNSLHFVSNNNWQDWGGEQIWNTSRQLTGLEIEISSNSENLTLIITNLSFGGDPLQFHDVTVDVDGTDVTATTTPSRYVNVDANGYLVIELAHDPWGGEGRFQAEINFASPVDLSQFSEFVMEWEVVGGSGNSGFTIELYFDDGSTTILSCGWNGATSPISFHFVDAWHYYWTGGMPIQDTSMQLTSFRISQNRWDTAVLTITSLSFGGNPLPQP